MEPILFHARFRESENKQAKRESVVRNGGDCQKGSHLGIERAGKKKGEGQKGDLVIREGGCP